MQKERWSKSLHQCTTCDMSFCNANDYKNHIQGKKHLKKVKIEEGTSPLKRKMELDLEIGSYKAPKVDTKWASVFPQAGSLSIFCLYFHALSGGFDFGITKSVGSEPSFFIMDEAFKVNQKYVKQLFPSVPQYYRTDQLPNDLRDNLDLVTSVAPCAGLSSLNTSTGIKRAGSNAVQNEWMVDAAKYTLGILQPKVYIGENAAKLFTPFGADFVHRLIEVAKEFGYSFSMYYTCSSLHGVPQKRLRTFYIFWKTPTAPILDWISVEAPTILECLEVSF